MWGVMTGWSIDPSGTSRGRAQGGASGRFLIPNRRIGRRLSSLSRGFRNLLVTYNARRGDMHRAREIFERMRARGIEPTAYVYSSLIHAYVVGRDMEEASSCVKKMKG